MSGVILPVARLWASFLPCTVNHAMLTVLQIRQCLCSADSPPNNKEVFSWILRCLLEGGVGTGGASGHVQRMAAFLEENGATKVEIESSSAVIKESDNNGT